VGFSLVEEFRAIFASNSESTEDSQSVRTTFSANLEAHSPHKPAPDPSSKTLLLEKNVLLAKIKEVRQDEPGQSMWPVRSISLASMVCD